MNDYQFRRCLICGTKSHRHYWKESKCPVCEIVSPYLESKHGGSGRTELQIENAKLKYFIDKIEVSTNNRVGKER